MLLRHCGLSAPGGYWGHQAPSKALAKLTPPLGNVASSPYNWPVKTVESGMRYLALLFVLVGVQSAWAQPSAQPTPAALANAYRCAELQDNMERLACYDEAVGRLRQAETQGQIVAIDREGVETLRQESFGFTLPNFARLIPGAGGSDGDLARIETQIDRIISRPSGRHSFVMSNGQVWEQVEPQRVSNIHAGDTVTIRQALMGSFMLSPERGAAHRVRRQN